MANKWNPLNKIIRRKKDQVNNRLSPELHSEFLKTMKMAEEALNLGKKVSVDDVKSKKLTTWNPLNKIIGRKKDQVNDRLSPEAYKKLLEVTKIAEEDLNLGKKVSVDDVKSKKPTWNPLNKIIGRKKDKLDFVQKSNVNSVVGELGNLKSKFQDLKKKVELIGESRKSDPSKYNEKSIEILQEKFNNVKSAARVVNNSLKEKVSFTKDQINLQSDIKKLKEALASPCFKIGNKTFNKKTIEKVLFKKEKSNHQNDVKKLKEALGSPCFKIGDKTLDKRTIEEAIKRKEERYKSNRIKIEKFSHGKADKELVEERKTSMGKFKQEIAKLEFTVRSIEKGKAPAPPVQKNMVEQQSKTTPLPSKDYIQHLDTLAGYVEQAGVYEGVTEYLSEVIDSVKELNVIGSNYLDKMHKSLSKPNITKQEFTNVINMLKDKVVNNDIMPKLSEENTYDTYTMKVMENRTNNTERGMSM